METTINYKEDYLGFLDGIRGFMAFWVFACHLKIYSIGDTNSWLGGGATAVDIFMLLSGFLMAYHWNTRKLRFNNFIEQTKDFYLRRFFRIAPLYYLLLTVAFIGYGYFSEISGLVNNFVHGSGVIQNLNLGNCMANKSDIKNIFLHYSFLFGLFPQYSVRSLMPDWSISLEMQFYLIFPLLIILINKYRMVLVVILAAILTIFTNNLIGVNSSYKILGYYPQPSLIFFKINIFVAGMCIAFAYLQKNRNKSILPIVLALLLLAVGKLLMVFCVLLIIWLLFSDFNKKTFTSKFVLGRLVKFLGDTSYSVYLLHQLILFPFLYLLFHQAWFVSFHPQMRFFVSFFFIGIPLYGISFLFFKFVELPCIKFGRHILKRN